MDLGLLGTRALWAHELLGSWAHGLMGCWAHGLLGSWALKSMDIGLLHGYCLKLVNSSTALEHSKVCSLCDFGHLQFF
jgi:hypothetical protein